MKKLLLIALLVTAGTVNAKDIICKNNFNVPVRFVIDNTSLVQTADRIIANKVNNNTFIADDIMLGEVRFTVNGKTITSESKNLTIKYICQ